MNEAEQCPECGYTVADARRQMDHHMCKNYPFFTQPGGYEAGSVRPGVLPSRDHMTAMNDYDVTAYRVFCYQWTCSCGVVNRAGEIIAGRSNECRGCHEKFQIIEYVNDNGAIMRLTTGKERP